PAERLARDDVAVFPPTCASETRNLSQGNSRASFHRDLVDLTESGEPDPQSIGREERSRCSLRARELGGLGLVQAPCVEFPVSARNARHVDQPPAVRGEGDVAVRSIWRQRDFRTKIDVQAD